MKHWLVIGGGTTGLAVSYHLSRLGNQVTVLEKELQMGGLARSYNQGSYKIDAYYHHMFTDQDEIIDLAGELGIEKNLVFKPGRMGFLVDGTFYSFSTLFDLLRFSPLSFFDRLRFGIALLYLRKIRNWQKLDRIYAADLLCRYFGGAAYRIVWEPLMQHKFTSSAKEISGAWIWDRLVNRSRSRKTGRESLGYINDGFMTLLDHLAAIIRLKNGSIRTGMSVERIIIDKNRFVGVLVGSERLKGDRCVVTAPLPLYLAMAPDLPFDYAQGLMAIKYTSVICLVLRLRQQLTDFYWTNIGDINMSFAVIIEHTNWIDPEFYNGEHLVYLAGYQTETDEGTYALPDQVIFNKYIQDLQLIFPRFQKSHVIGYQVFRDHYAQPVFCREYAKMCPGFATPVKGLFLVNSSQVYPQSRTLNSCLQLSREFASRFGSD